MALTWSDITDDVVRIVQTSSSTDEVAARCSKLLGREVTYDAVSSAMRRLRRDHGVDIPVLMDVLGELLEGDEDVIIKLPKARKGPDVLPRIVSSQTVPERIAFIPDCHFPHQDQRAIDAVVACLRDYKPQRIVLAGDLLDCAALSRHDTAAEKLRDVKYHLQEEIDAALPFQRVLIDISNGNVDWIEGNHEARRNVIINTRPGLLGLESLKARNLFSIPDEINWVPRNKRLRIGNMYFEHGDQILNSRGNKHIASAMLDRRPHLNTFTGHWHCVDSKSKVVYMPDTDQPEAFMCASVGHLSTVLEHNHYAKLPNWTHGFALFDTWQQNGKTRFTFHQIRIFDSEFMFGGKLYSGKKLQ